MRLQHTSELEPVTHTPYFALAVLLLHICFAWVVRRTPVCSFLTPFLSLSPCHEALYEEADVDADVGMPSRLPVAARVGLRPRHTRGLTACAPSRLMPPTHRQQLAQTSDPAPGTDASMQDEPSLLSPDIISSAVMKMNALHPLLERVERLENRQC